MKKLFIIVIKIFIYFKLNKINKLIKLILSKFGYKIIKNDILDFNFALEKIFKIYEINLIFDIGSNIGQFSKKILNLSYKKKIILIEPVNKTFLALKNNFQNKNNLEFLNIGIGTETSNLKMYKSIRGGDKSDMNSLLKINNAGEKLVKNAAITSEEEVKIININEFLKNYNLENTLFKIDIEGYDFKVLKHIKKEYLQQITCILCEIQNVKMWEGQENNFTKELEFFESNNFKLFAIDPFFINPSTGQLIAIDALFVNKKIIPKSLDLNYNEKIGHPEIFN
jgi:FkbM family methyltransferase